MECKRILFIGGIHGVGKGRICSAIKEAIDIETISASDLIKWSEISKIPGNKAVENISNTQQRLIQGLDQLKGNSYIIDGHFTLLDKNLEITDISPEVFKQINPFHLSIVIDSPKEVRSRLLNRDGIDYDLEKLNSMQTSELRNAKEISSKLNIPLTIVKNGDISELLALLKM